MTVPPVLLIFFRRPETTAQVFEAIRAARPERLYLAADGPRAHRDGEAVLCQKTREVVARVDWPCQVETLFRDSNVGIRKNVSEAITWFLDQVGEGIILEDDCLPNPDFFRFAAENLDRYRNDERVMQICGSSFLKPDAAPASYFFSRYGHGWGWATWKRAWSCLDLGLESLEPFLSEARQASFWDTPRERKYWEYTFRRTRDLPIDTWDYQWKFSQWKSGGLSLYPWANLVTNLGFGEGATNTTQTGEAKGDRPFEPLGDLVHPSFVIRNRAADQHNFLHMYWGTPWARFQARLAKVWRLVRGRR